MKGPTVAWLYLAVCLLFAPAFAVLLPPFHAADEYNHLLRADQVAGGGWLPSRRAADGGLVAGGEADPAISAAAAPFLASIGVPGPLASAPASTLRERLGAPRRWAAAPSAATYAPIFYLPAAGALTAGRHWRWTALDTLLAARLVNAAACAALGFLALRVARAVQLPMFALLTLPMSLALGAGVTPNGLVLGAAALGAAILSRGPVAGRPLTSAEFGAATAALALAALHKAPYALLLLPLLFAPGGRSWRMAAVCAAAAAAAAFSLWTSSQVATPLARPGVHVDAGEQLSGLLSDPARVVSIANETLRLQWRQYVMQFLGYLGELEVLAPRWAYAVAALGVLAAGLAATPRAVPRPWRPAWLAVWVAGALTTGALFGALYLGFNGVGSPWVEGVQGRYFLPVALVGLLLVAGSGARLTGRTAPLGTAAAACAVLAPGLVLPATAGAVLKRYYSPPSVQAALAQWPLLSSEHGAPLLRTGPTP